MGVGKGDRGTELRLATWFSETAASSSPNVFDVLSVPALIHPSFLFSRSLWSCASRQEHQSLRENTLLGIRPDSRSTLSSHPVHPSSHTFFFSTAPYLASPAALVVSGIMRFTVQHCLSAQEGLRVRFMGIGNLVLSLPASHIEWLRTKLTPDRRHLRLAPAHHLDRLLEQRPPALSHQVSNHVVSGLFAESRGPP